ncbi:uncharacterized protein LOC131955162 [Physella acuta]|uniref:uncharacterized protein LOC131955162 n=1 Tax=Physella acuta TaxID=109671 RepID=UPI0027DC3D9E|nr:uncharacterized protein LOC131955162 [Physella acuta]
MTVSGEVCTGYFKCFNKLWTDEELCDFTVQICDVSIKCHRVILGACSPFFLGLLRSGMKEANEGRVVLQDISVSTFQLILKTLYTGEDVLSLDNFIEIWHAVDMLQIGFLVELCETFAAKNIKLENFTRILSSAKLLDSKSVLTLVKNFMVQNIKAIHETKRFVEISSDEMLCLIGRHDLNFTSEYSVLEIVLDWIDFKDSQIVNSCTGNNKKLKTTVPLNTLQNYITRYMLRSCLKDDIGPENKYDATNDEQEANQQKNENSKQADSLCCISKPKTQENLRSDILDQLNILLSHVRICTISPGLLMNFLEHRIIKQNDTARQIIISAILKQASFRHGQWPTAGIHRQFHEYGNYGVYLSHLSVYILDPFDEEMYKLKLHAGYLHKVQLVSFDSKLYAAGESIFWSNDSSVYVYSNNTWKHLTDIPKSKLLIASNEQHIYITSVVNNVIYQFDPKSKPPIMIPFSTVPKGYVARQVMSYQIYLIFFCTEKVNRIETTAVHMLDLQEKSWTRLDNLNGPADNIISFRNDDNHFVLQTNGNLWVLKKNDDIITFTRVAKLWRQELILYGAVVYGEKLVISYKNSENIPKDSFVYTLDNMFLTIMYWKIQSCGSNFIPCVLNKSYLSEYSNHLDYDSYSDSSD